MADEALVAGLEKVQVDETQQTGNLKASKEESSVVPEKLQCDSSESEDSGSEKDKHASLVKGESQEGKKKKLPKKIKKKKVIKKTKGDPSTTDKLQCDSSSSKSSGDENSKSESRDDSSNSKSGSGDDSKSSKSASRDDSKYKSGSANEKDASASKVGMKEKKKKKKKALRKNLNKTTKKTEKEASTNDKLLCDSDSKSDSSDSKSDSDSKSSDSKSSDSKSDSKSDSGDDSPDSKFSDSKSNSGDDSACSKAESGPTAKKKKEKSGEENQTVTDPLMVSPVAKADEPTATENSTVTQEIREDQNAGKEVKNDEASAQREKEKKSIVGKIMEKLPGYYRNSGE